MSIFTAAGAIIVEWNVADPHGVKGGSGMWDSHIRFDTSVFVVVGFIHFFLGLSELLGAQEPTWNLTNAPRTGRALMTLATLPSSAFTSPKMLLDTSR